MLLLLLLLLWAIIWDDRAGIIAVFAVWVRDIGFGVAFALAAGKTCARGIIVRLPVLFFFLGNCVEEYRDNGNKLKAS